MTLTETEEKNITDFSSMLPAHWEVCKDESMFCWVSGYSVFLKKNQTAFLPPETIPTCVAFPLSFNGIGSRRYLRECLNRLFHVSLSAFDLHLLPTTCTWDQRPQAEDKWKSETAVRDPSRESYSSWSLIFKAEPSCFVLWQFSDIS